MFLGFFFFFLKLYSDFISVEEFSDMRKQYDSQVSALTEKISNMEKANTEKLTNDKLKQLQDVLDLKEKKIGKANTLCEAW